jgi:hypothetical protein
MGATSRRKGTRRELECAKLLGGRRVPLSGSAGGPFGGDVVLANGWKVQCKARADGCRTLYRELEAGDVLAVGADRRRGLVVLSLERLAELPGTEGAGGANGLKRGPSGE